MTDSRPRLFALLASEAPVGVVFRRGPSKLVRVFSWDRERDKFKEGQRFRGRILNWDCDISPDGRFMIYSAMGAAAWAIPETGGTWTAISRVPSLTAIALWGAGGSTRGCGGMFTSNRSYWLRADDNTFLIRDTNLLRRDPQMGPRRAARERDGWVQTDRVFEKRLPKGWVLRMTKRHPRKDLYELVQIEDRTTLRFPDWQWAEWDRNRLVWAEGGCICAAKIGMHKMGTVRTLWDFR